MAKKITEWRIFILATTNRKEEVRQMRCFLNHLNGKPQKVNFQMKLVGFNEEWNNVIETSRVVQFTGNKKQVEFQTQSGSIYLANMDDFGGFFCRTIAGEIQIPLP